ncbi:MULTISPECIES: VOC family protein [Streptomyces]|uniref:VOC family protein n=1 Tax=Streptomyces TaxID=1883 RepID=UPI0016719639|nr:MULTISPECIES: VOC family protein [Streptomyces]MBD3580380.1 VOC family protein [Streptomyces sp. KD18]
MTGPYRPGTPCWIDLMVPDQQAALDFYTGLFGWTGEIGPPETGGYSVCEYKGQPVAGIMKAMNPDGSVPDPMPPAAWTTYLAVHDVHEVVRAGAAAGGGTLVDPTDVMDLGRMAVLSDPTGAVYGIWQAGTFRGAGIVNEDGTLTWNELATGDPGKAAAYYAEILPITPTPSEMPGAEGYTEIKVNDRAVGGIMSLDQHPKGTPPHWLPYFRVADADATQAAAERAGGSVMAPAFDMPVGRMAVLADPQGAVFAVITPNEAPEQPDPM